MRIILDSNVIIAAFSSRGLCQSLFELCITRYIVVISDHILSEVYRILHEKLKMPQKSVVKITDYLNEFCENHPYEKLTENICRDEDDDEILALAHHTSIDYIITGDKVLLVLEKFGKIPIVTPRDFWQIAREKSN